ncbi:MAG: hypothetical protein HYU28_04000 [Actinobacteria bacterium]|nr:hypothetical protein [Actinomycetota bacterium]
MSAEITALLSRAVPETGPPDLDQLWRAGHRRRRARRVRALAGSVAVVATTSLVAPNLLGDEDATTVGAGPKGIWTLVAPSPLSPRFGHSAVFTGAEFLVWGGANGDDGFADGAAYDPTTDTWRTIAPAPIQPRQDHVAVWTGTEMIVWGGAWNPLNPPPSDFGGSCTSEGAPMRNCLQVFTDGAAYNPETDTWRSIAPALEVSGYEGLSVGTWTGDEIVIVGRRFLERPVPGAVASSFAVSYRPADDTWHRLPDPPAGDPAQVPQLVWTGNEIVALSSEDADTPSGSQPFALTYAPGADRWQRLPGVTNGAFGAAAWTGKEAITWVEPTGARGRAKEGRGGALVFDPRAETWGWAAEAPFGPRERPLVVSVGASVLVWGGSDLAPNDVDGALYDPVENTWSELPPAPIAPRFWTPGVAGDGRVFVWGGMAGSDDPLGDGALLAVTGGDGDRTPPRPSEEGTPREPAERAGDGVVRKGEGHVVAEGDVEGEPWKLVVYDSTRGICVDLHFDRAAGGGCGFPVPDQSPLAASLSESRRGGHAFVLFVHGVARSDVTKVRVDFRSGSTTTLTTVGHDAGLGVVFFVLPVPVGEEVLQLVAVTEDGREVGRHQLSPERRDPETLEP